MDLTHEYQSLVASIEEAQREIAAGQQLLRLILRFQAQAASAAHTIVSAQHSRMDWRLETPTGVVQLLPGASLLVGRQEGCDVRLADQKASRQHARIERRGEVCRVVDLGSSNGVHLNGRRVQREARLADGDLLLIGDTQLVVRAPAAEPSNAQTLAAGSLAPDSSHARD